MDRTSINQNAHLIWNVLGDNREWTYKDLKKATGLADRDLNAAIGWLAYENKIYFENTCGRNFVSLGVNIYIG